MLQPGRVGRAMWINAASSRQHGDGVIRPSRAAHPHECCSGGHRRWRASLLRRCSVGGDSIGGAAARGGGQDLGVGHHGLASHGPRVVVLAAQSRIRARAVARRCCGTQKSSGCGGAAENAVHNATWQRALHDNRARFSAFLRSDLGAPGGVAPTPLYKQSAGPAETQATMPTVWEVGEATDQSARGRYDRRLTFHSCLSTVLAGHAAATSGSI